MKPIGGYLELELKKGAPYHTGLALNTGRNAFEYILRCKKFKKILLPYYICAAVLEPLSKLKIPYVFYHINENLEPINNLSHARDEAILYVNYFSLKNNYISKLAQRYENLIIDNSQAFFCLPVPSIDTFYSARKFFGVPDGAYLYSTTNLEESFKVDYSFNRMAHLVKRIDLGAEQGYKDFLKNEARLSNQPIRLLSKLTSSMLSNVNYDYVKKCRENNFSYLHKHLSGINKLNIDLKNIHGPMVYPFLYEKEGLKEKMIANKIYIATYWPNVLDQCNSSEWEYYLAKYLIPLPIDQRYGFQEMNLVLEQLL